MAPEPPLFSQLTFMNALSFGPERVTLPLERLNVLIGPNGSGKSNVLELIGLLAAAPSDLAAAVRSLGGMHDLLWKGPGAADYFAVEAQTNLLVPGGTPKTVDYRLALARDGQSTWRVLDESLGTHSPGASAEQPGGGELAPYRRNHPDVAAGGGFLQATAADGQTYAEVVLHSELHSQRSITAVRRSARSYPTLTRFAEALEGIRQYRSWPVGPTSALRSPCGADARTDRLEPSLDNLPARLAAFKRDPAAKQALLSGLTEIGEAFTDLEIVPEGGRLTLYLHEGPARSIAASRLSDGTLRYLALLTILLDPTPPPLITIEEPELGLHPDLINSLARHLVAASERTQLVVTTHSEVLVSALKERPEAIVVCERHDGRTAFRRLSANEVGPYLERYQLGELWLRGHVGGVRW